MAKINVRDYSVGLPEKSAVDVVRRKLTIGGSGVGDPSLTSEFLADFALGDAGPPSFDVTVLEGQTGVELSLVDVDNAGNESAARTFTFDSTDTQAPAQPGEFSVTPMGERIIDV